MFAWLVLEVERGKALILLKSPLTARRAMKRWSCGIKKKLNNQRRGKNLTDIQSNKQTLEDILIKKFFHSFSLMPHALMKINCWIKDQNMNISCCFNSPRFHPCSILTQGKIVSTLCYYASVKALDFSV